MNERFQGRHACRAALRSQVEHLVLGEVEDFLLTAAVLVSVLKNMERKRDNLGKILPPPKDSIRKGDKTVLHRT